MSFDWTSALTSMREVVHQTFSTPVEYEAPGAPGVWVVLGVRWHGKLALHGDLSGLGYAEVIEGIDRVLFNRDELVTKGVTPARRGRVRFGPAFQGIILQLETSEPSDGPVNVVWKVTRP